MYHVIVSAIHIIVMKLTFHELTSPSGGGEGRVGGGVTAGRDKLKAADCCSKPLQHNHFLSLKPTTPGIFNITPNFICGDKTGYFMPKQYVFLTWVFVHQLNQLNQN